MIKKLRERWSGAGQAIVEFALAATIIFSLISAAVDLGLMFFTLQGVNNAAQEGARYGARWLNTDPATGERSLQFAEIRNRVRFEGGGGLGTGVANMQDLNNDGAIDLDDGSGNPGREAPGSNDPLITQYIDVELLGDVNFDDNIVPDPDCLNQPAGQRFRHACYVRVTVSYDYDIFFGIVPVFNDQVRITRSHTERVIDPFSVTGSGPETLLDPFTPTPTNTPLPTPTNTGTPTNTPTGTLTDTPIPSDTPTPSDTPIASDTPTPGTPTTTNTPGPSPTPTNTPTDTATPTPTPQLHIDIIIPENDAVIVDERTDTNFRFVGYDRSDPNFQGEGLQSDGIGVDYIEYELRDPDGIVRKFDRDSNRGYCMFGSTNPGRDEAERGDCDPVSEGDVGRFFPKPGVYEIRARTVGFGGRRTLWNTRNFIVPEFAADIQIVDDNNPVAGSFPDNRVIETRDDTRFRALVNATSPVQEVEFEIITPSGGRFYRRSDDTEEYCAFGGSCNRMSDGDFRLLLDGTYTLQVRARGDFAWTEWVEKPFVIPPIDLFIAYADPIDGAPLTTVDTAVVTQRIDSAVRAIIYDPEEVTGEPAEDAPLADHEPFDGEGIDQAQWEIIAPPEFQFLQRVNDDNDYFCAFGPHSVGSSSCNTMSSTNWGRYENIYGTYTVRVRARSTSSGRYSNWKVLDMINPAPPTPTPTITPTPSNTPTVTPTPIPCEPDGDRNLPAGWTGTNIGNGSGSADGIGGTTIQVCGSSGNVWNNADNLRFVHKTVDWSSFQEIYTTITEITEVDGGGDLPQWAKMGIMIRDSTDAGAANIFMRVHHNATEVSVQGRDNDGGSSYSTTTSPGWQSINLPVRIRLRKDGSQVRSYYWSGGNWVEYYSRNVNFSGTVDVGVVVSTDNTSRDARVRFDNIQVIP